MEYPIQIGRPSLIDVYNSRISATEGAVLYCYTGTWDTESPIRARLPSWRFKLFSCTILAVCRRDGREDDVFILDFLTESGGESACPKWIGISLRGQSLRLVPIPVPWQSQLYQLSQKKWRGCGIWVCKSLCQGCYQDLWVSRKKSQSLTCGW